MGKIVKSVALNNDLTIYHRLVYSAQEPTIPLHMQAVWGLDSGKVGLVFIAAVVPTLFCAFFISSKPYIWSHQVV